MALALDDVGLTVKDRFEFALNARWLAQRTMIELGLGWAIDAVNGAASDAANEALSLLSDARSIIEQAETADPQQFPSLLKTSTDLYLASVRSERATYNDPIRLAHHVVEGVLHWVCLLRGLPPLCEMPGAPVNTECLYSDSELHWAQLRGQKSGASGWAAKMGTVRTYEDHDLLATGRMLYRALIGWLTEVVKRRSTLLADHEAGTDAEIWAGMLHDVGTASRA
jgi:hypothetical protein